MAAHYDRITEEQAVLIRNAPVFFAASADPALTDGPDGVGPVNVSPKGGVPLHVLDANRVAYLDYGGSGNETARHSIAGGPVTIMVCSFEEWEAAIVRLYGRARIVPLERSPIAELLQQHPARALALPQRQAIEVDVERTSTSCGYGVPLMAYSGERTKDGRGRRYKEKTSYVRS